MLSIESLSRYFEILDYVQTQLKFVQGNPGKKVHNKILQLFYQKLSVDNYFNNVLVFMGP